MLTIVQNCKAKMTTRAAKFVCKKCFERTTMAFCISYWTRNLTSLVAICVRPHKASLQPPPPSPLPPPHCSFARSKWASRCERESWRVWAAPTTTILQLMPLLPQLLPHYCYFRRELFDLRGKNLNGVCNKSFFSDDLLCIDLWILL